MGLPLGDFCQGSCMAASAMITNCVVLAAYTVSVIPACHMQELGLPLALGFGWSSPAGLTTSCACVLMCRSKLLLPEHSSSVPQAAPGCRLTFLSVLCSAHQHHHQYRCCGYVRRVSIKLHHQPSPEVQGHHLRQFRERPHCNTLVSPFPQPQPRNKRLSLPSSELEGHRLHHFRDHVTAALA